MEIFIYDPQRRIDGSELGTVRKRKFAHFPIEDATRIAEFSPCYISAKLFFMEITSISHAI